MNEYGNQYILYKYIQKINKFIKNIFIYLVSNYFWHFI